MAADGFTDRDRSRTSIGRDLRPVRQAHLGPPDRPTYIPCVPEPGSGTVGLGIRSGHGRSPEELQLDVVWVAEGEHCICGVGGLFDTGVAYSQLV